MSEQEMFGVMTRAEMEDLIREVPKIADLEARWRAERAGARNHVALGAIVAEARALAGMSHYRRVTEPIRQKMAKTLHPASDPELAMIAHLNVNFTHDGPRKLDWLLFWQSTADAIVAFVEHSSKEAA